MLSRECGHEILWLGKGNFPKPFMIKSSLCCYPLHIQSQPHESINKKLVYKMILQHAFALPSQDHKSIVCSTSQSQHQREQEIPWKMWAEIFYATSYTWKEKKCLVKQKYEFCNMNWNCHHEGQKPRPESPKAGSLGKQYQWKEHINAL